MKDFIQMLYIESSRAIADMVTTAIDDDPQYFKKILDISFYEKSPVCWRAARVVDFCCEKNPDLIVDYLPEIVDKLKSFRTDGQKRAFLNILKRFELPLDEDYTGILLELSYQWINDSRQPVAVRALCMDIAYDISNREPELKPEVLMLFEKSSLFQSKGLKNKSGKMVKQLKKEITGKGVNRM
jgi:hypothetical protein